MDKEYKTDLKFYQMMVIKPFKTMCSGAFAGTSFNAKSMGEMCDIIIESTYVNINSNVNSRRLK